MTEELKTALDAIAAVQKLRALNWLDECAPGFQERENLHLIQLATLKRQVKTIENGTYQSPITHHEIKH